MEKISRRRFIVRGTTACLCLSGLGAGLNTARADSPLSKSVEENPVDMVLQMKERLYGMHLKDHTHIGRDDPRETILGEGAIDLPGLCAALRKTGFDEPISLEFEFGSPMEGIRKGLFNFAAAAN